MNYRNYERKVVEEFGVELKGFPGGGTVRQPGEIPQYLLQKLIQALKATSGERCYWVALTEEEWEARITRNKEREASGDVVYIPRKKQATRVPKYFPRRQLAAGVHSDSSSNSDSSDEDQD
jgi:hypothetical protein